MILGGCLGAVSTSRHCAFIEHVEWVKQNRCVVWCLCDLEGKMGSCWDSGVGSQAGRLREFFWASIRLGVGTETLVVANMFVGLKSPGRMRHYNSMHVSSHESWEGGLEWWKESALVCMSEISGPRFSLSGPKLGLWGLFWLAICVRVTICKFK